MRGWGLGLVAGAMLTVSAAPAPLLLAGDGLTVGSRAATFGRTSRAEAVALVSASLGAPVKQGSHGDCGAGAVIGFAKFRGAFELSFVRGRLSGWTADAAAPRTAKGIGVGATLAAVRAAYPDIEVDAGDEANGGLGPSFAREGGPNGWLNGVRPGSKVTGLYAGATCLAGV